MDDSGAAAVDTELKRSEADEPITLSLAAASAAAKAAAAAAGGGADKQHSRLAGVAAPPLFGDDDGECLVGLVQLQLLKLRSVGRLQVLHSP